MIVWDECQFDRLCTMKATGMLGEVSICDRCRRNATKDEVAEQILDIVCPPYLGFTSDQIGPR